MRILRKTSLLAKVILFALVVLLIVWAYSFSQSELVTNHNAAGESDESLYWVKQQVERLDLQNLAEHAGVLAANVTQPVFLDKRWLLYRFGEHEVHVASEPVTDFKSAANFDSVCKAEALYQSALTEMTAGCSPSRRFGRQGDGGWDVCMSGPFKPKPGSCVSISFGVGSIWEYDDEIAEHLRCRAFAFDPTEKLKNYTRPSGLKFFQVGVASRRGLWRETDLPVDTFGSLADSLIGSEAVVDVLKLDIEMSEWEVLQQAAEAGALTRVKQLLVEFHTKDMPAASGSDAETSVEDFKRFISILKMLHSKGFRLWRSQVTENGLVFFDRCGRYKRYCCYNNYYININYLAANREAEARAEAVKARNQNTIRLLPMQLPNPASRVSSVEPEQLYFDLMEATHAECPTWQRVGPNGDSGYNLCVTEDYKLKRGCVVYSFGVSDQFGFEDELAKSFSCRVRMFDPSEGSGDHKRAANEWFHAIGLSYRDAKINNWQMRTLSSLLFRFGDHEKVIDVLKVDIEHAEWSALEQAVHDLSISRVKQLLLETHTMELMDKSSSDKEYLRYISVWYSLYRIGFRQWYSWVNPRTHFRSKSGHSRPCCHVHSFVNIRFITDARS